jgi:hypothetical protein
MAVDPASLRRVEASPAPHVEPPGSQPAAAGEQPPAGPASGPRPSGIKARIPLYAPSTPVPKLERPLVLIAGGVSRHIGLKPVIHYFCEGSENRFGGSYCVDRAGQFEDEYRKKGGNVFTLQFSQQFGSFEHDAAEIRQFINDVRRLTGSAEVDVVAECKGAMSFREYVREGVEGVRNVVELVPPNRGIPVAGNLIALASLLPFKKLGAIKLNRDSRHAMREFRTDWRFLGLKGNPQIRRLNTPQNLEHEKQSLHSLTVVAGTGNLQGQRKIIGRILPAEVNEGDDSVPEWSAFATNANNFFYAGERSVHPMVQAHPGALAKVADAIVSDGHPQKDANYRAAVPTGTRVAIETGVLATGFVARAAAFKAAVTGAMLGPVGHALGVVGATVSFVDAARHFASIPMAPGTKGKIKAFLGGLGRTAQGLGTLGIMAGFGLPAAGVLAGGFLLTAGVGNSLPVGFYKIGVKHSQPRQD